MVSRKHWSDALLFASVFLPAERRAKFFKLYLQQFYQRQSPFYAMLLVLTGNADHSQWTEQQTSWMLDNWKV